MDPFARRLRRCRIAANINQTTVAQACGVSRAAVAQWEAGGCHPRDGTLMKVATLFGVSVGWLMGEAGAQAKLGERPFSGFIRTIPLVTHKRAAKWNDEIIRRGDGLLSLLHTGEHVGRSTFALKVKDRSMEPRLVLDDIVFVDPNVNPMPGDLVVGQGPGTDEAIIRKFRPQPAAPTEYPEMTLMPLNPDWPVVTYGVDNPGRIIGTVTVLHRQMTVGRD